MQFTISAFDVIGRIGAALLRPAEAVTPSTWAAANLTVPDGPRANERWDPSLTPYIIEPLNNMGPDSPVNKEVIRKSAQTGFTVMAIAAAGSWIDTDPAGGILLVQPTDGALSDFISDKLNPAIEHSPAPKAKIKPQVSRSGEGSTTYLRRYPGGSMALAIANSTADLRSKTKRKVIKDEASEYPADLDGQGSPHAMIEARYESFRATGDWKELNISTPTVVGVCYIDDEFKRGDQRYWNVACPGCAERFAFRFGAQFRYNEVFPFHAHYVAPCCGTIIEGHQKSELVKRGEWIASAPGPGKFPSYHFDAMSSPFVPWDLIAERWIEAQKDPAKLKAFYNLTLGEAYEIKGDAPDWKRLMERREDYPKGRIPPRGLMLTAAADVQLRGIYVEIVAWAPNRESWVVHTEVIEGDTTDANAGAFLRLAELYAREWPAAFGDRRRVDAFGVDSGFRSHVVYNWCRTRHNAYATDGRDGWNKPALGTPSLVDVDLDGHKIGTTRIWPVGTWPLKAHWYEDLRREGRQAGHESDPPGYCHFHMDLDEKYFRQVTSEYLAEKTRGGSGKKNSAGGRKIKMWDVRGAEENHFLDCRIGNMALADHLGLSSMTADEWKILARERAPGMNQGDLFAPLSVKIQTAASLASAAVQSSEPAPDAGGASTAVESPVATPDVPEQPARSQAEPQGSGWIGRDVSGWLDR